MATKVKNLGDILPPEMREGQAESVEDYINTPLVFHTFSPRQGTNGEYYRIVVSTPEDDKQFYLSTGAAQPKEVLSWAKEQRQFPFVGKFVKAGRAYLLVDPSRE